MSIAKTIYATPGSRGTAGVDAVAGTPGVDAFTTTEAQFIMPAVNGSTVVSVNNSVWAAIGQSVFVEGAGQFEVVAKPTSTQLTLKNLGYAANFAPATVVALGKRVSPSGVAGGQGSDALAGADGTAKYMVQSATNAPVNSFNLGALTNGLMKITVAGATATPSTAVAGVDYQAVDAELTALAGLASAADKVPYFTGSGAAALTNFKAFGRTLAGCVTAADGQTALGLGTASTVTQWTMANSNHTGSMALASTELVGIANGANVDVDTTSNPVAVILTGPTGAFTINGLVYYGNQFAIIINTTAHNMTIAHDSGVESTANRRIVCPTGADMSTTGYGVAILWHDSTNSCWRLLSLST
jgi:hypothetical protein